MAQPPAGKEQNSLSETVPIRNDLSGSRQRLTARLVLALGVKAQF